MQSLCIMQQSQRRGNLIDNRYQLSFSEGGLESVEKTYHILANIFLDGSPLLYPLLIYY